MHTKALKLRKELKCECSGNAGFKIIHIFSSIKKSTYYFIHFIFYEKKITPLPHCHLERSKLKITSCHKATNTVHQGTTLTHFCVDLLEGRIILIYLKVDFCRGDGESPLGHYHRSNELGWGTEYHWACKPKAQSQADHLFPSPSHKVPPCENLFLRIC